MADLDVAPLTVEPTKEQIRAYRATGATSGAGGALIGGLALIPIVIIGIAVLAGVGGRGVPVGWYALAGVVIGAVIVVGILIAIRRGWARRTRLALFAARNGMTYTPDAGAPTYPGAIFGIGSSRTVFDLFRGARGRPFELGNYRYTTGSGKNRTTHRWGFVTLQLDRRLPHMVLDAKSNNGLFGQTDLPVTFSRDQVLSLEGDFDRYFRLFCPKEYERDALYVFTPDLMAELIDEASAYDVEIVDDRMFVYQSGGALPVESPAFWQRMMRILDTVGATTVEQTDYYADDRVGDRAADIVAPQGRRLHRGFPIAGVVIAVVIVAYIVIANLMTMR